jgi:ribosomal protein S1
MVEGWPDRVTRVADFGPFVELEPGVEGLIPLSESGLGRDGDVKKAFRVGDELQVVVLDVDPAAHRIRLSVTAVQTMREADEMREYSDRADAAAPERFGTLADKLRDALKKP